MRSASTAVCVIALAGSSLAAKIEKRAQSLWQKTPLMLRTCPVEGATLFVTANGQIAGPAQQTSHDFCLLEFSSVKQVEDAVVLSGALTQARAEGDELTLKAVNHVEPFRISLECPEKTATDQRLDFFDRALFSHAELHIGEPVPQYFRRIVEQYLGIVRPAPLVAVATVPPANHRSEAGFVHAPQIRSAPDPSYSSEARSRRIEGTVVVWMIVEKDGHTRDHQVTKPLGYGLDEQALKAVRNWTFEPATKDKQPVAVVISVEVNFHLY